MLWFLLNNRDNHNRGVEGKWGNTLSIGYPLAWWQASIDGMRNCVSTTRNYLFGKYVKRCFTWLCNHSIWRSSGSGLIITLLTISPQPTLICSDNMQMSLRNCVVSMSSNSTETRRKISLKPNSCIGIQLWIYNRTLRVPLS